MKPITLLAKSTLLFALTFGLTISFLLVNHKNPSPIQPDPMARSFVLWLHGLGDSGPANEPIKTFFTSPPFRNTKWSFPSAPSNPVTCNYGAVMPSWFDIHEIPVTALHSGDWCVVLFHKDGATLIRTMTAWILNKFGQAPPTRESPKDEGSVLKAVQNVHAMIDKEIAAGTDPKNVFVCGFSQGGALTLSSVLLYPHTLGGAAVFSGWVPFNSSMLERITPDAKKTPFLWSHGVADRTVLFEAGQAGPPFLEKAGVTCEFKAYPGLGHSISNEELRDLESWIKSRLQSSS